MEGWICAEHLHRVGEERLDSESPASSLRAVGEIARETEERLDGVSVNDEIMRIRSMDTAVQDAGIAHHPGQLAVQYA
jgi:hypothetical protein